MMYAYNCIAVSSEDWKHNRSVYTSIIAGISCALGYDIVTATLSLGNRNSRLVLISKKYLYIHSLPMAKMFHKAWLYLSWSISRLFLLLHSFISLYFSVNGITC